MTDPDDILDIVDILRSSDRSEPHTCNAAANEIEQLRKQRDEARRSYCYATGNGYEQRAINVAQSKGWDCFKEDTND